MKANQPQTGLVIRHMNLWRDEAKEGHEEGRKDQGYTLSFQL